MIEIAESISSFSPVSPVSQPDQLQVILDRLQALEERVAAQDEEIARLEAHIAAQDQKIAALERQQELDEEAIALDIAHDRQRITKLEIPPEPAPAKHTFKTATHLNTIYDALQDREKECRRTGSKIDFMAYWEVEELLGLSHRRVSQLAEIAANDPRFIIAWHPRKKNMKVFKLNPFGTLGKAAEALSKNPNRPT